MNFLGNVEDYDYVDQMPSAEYVESNRRPNILSGKIVKVFPKSEKSHGSRDLITHVNENKIIKPMHIAPWLQQEVLKDHLKPPVKGIYDLKVEIIQKEIMISLTFCEGHSLRPRAFVYLT